MDKAYQERCGQQSLAVARLRCIASERVLVVGMQAFTTIIPLGSSQQTNASESPNICGILLRAQVGVVSAKLTGQLAEVDREQANEMLVGSSVVSHLTLRR
jgi:hypothetical protein